MSCVVLEWLNKGRADFKSYRRPMTHYGKEVLCLVHGLSTAHTGLYPQEGVMREPIYVDCCNRYVGWKPAPYSL